MQSTRLTTKKQELLESEGYRYNFDRQLYFNRAAKKAFSIEFVEDRPMEELERYVRENSPSTDWQFFFNSSLPENPSLSDAVKRELVHLLG